MNIYKSGVYLKGAIYRPTSLGDALEIVCTATLPVGATLKPGDQIKFCKVGENVRIQDFVLETDELDTGSALTFNLGTTGAPTSLLSADTVGRAGGERIRRSSDATAGNAFATSPYVPSPDVQEVVATVVAGPAGDPETVRNISLKLKLFFTPGELQLVGLDNVGWGPGETLQGTKVYEPASINTYNGNV